MIFLKIYIMNLKILSVWRSKVWLYNVDSTLFDFDRMMVMRYDSLDKMSGMVDYDAHIDQLDEPPTCQRMGIMASFNSMEEFEMWV